MARSVAKGARLEEAGNGHSQRKHGYMLQLEVGLYRAKELVSAGHSEIDENTIRARSKAIPAPLIQKAADAARAGVVRQY